MSLSKPKTLLTAMALMGLLPYIPSLTASPGRGPSLAGNTTPGQFTKALREDALKKLKRAKESQPEQEAIQDAATHEQLAKALSLVQREDPMKLLKPSEGEDPTKVNQPQDIIASSDILCFRGMATLVPKRAILQIPENYQKRLELQAGAQIRTWAEFYTANRAWIRTVEVDRLQAEGNSPLSEETTKMVDNADSIIVATFKGGPISVLPLKVPEVEGEAVTESTPPLPVDSKQKTPAKP
ncbi:MAG: hypothetical protein AB7I98_20175 [Verrucomicrobiales bacterium]|nr:hypothetical protein [Verrucomicrobiae bacterium]MCP5553604.1 hypothetical protein [Akkermansiaceae bacterium]